MVALSIYALPVEESAIKAVPVEEATIFAWVILATIRLPVVTFNAVIKAVPVDELIMLA